MLQQISIKRKARFTSPLGLFDADRIPVSIADASNTEMHAQLDLTFDFLYRSTPIFAVKPLNRALISFLLAWKTMRDLLLIHCQESKTSRSSTWVQEWGIGQAGLGVVITTTISHTGGGAWNTIVVAHVSCEP